MSKPTSQAFDKTLTVIVAVLFSVIPISLISALFCVWVRDYETARGLVLIFVGVSILLVSLVSGLHLGGYLDE